MRPDEEADKSFGVSPPNSEREFERFRVDFDIVVADQNGAGFDGPAGEKSSVETV